MTSRQDAAALRLARLAAHLSSAPTTASGAHLCPAPVDANGKHTDGTPCQYIFPGQPGPLTEEDKAHYEEHGFVVIRSLYPKDLLETYRARFQDICDGKIDRPMTSTVMKDVALAKSGKLKQGESNITKLQDFQDDEVLFSYCSYPDILKYVQQFTGPNSVAIHTMLINKPSDPGQGTSRHPMHQDQYYFPFGPSDRIVCSWTAMQKIDRQNGCLVVLPGTHKTNLRPHGYPNWEGGVNAMYHGIQDIDQGEIDQRLHLEMEAGDTVFFHPLLIHGSGTNNSSGFRKSISCHYASADCDFHSYLDSYHANIAKEVEAQAKRRTGLDLTFHDVWKIKGRLVSGRGGPMTADVDIQ